jgi:amidohydrolase
MFSDGSRFEVAGRESIRSSGTLDLITMTTTELDTLIATRRDLHRHPEIGFQERRTAGIVEDRLRAAGYEVETGIAVTGVVGTIRGAGEGPTLLLRADMDALPIHEECSHDFVSSVPGRMHACGHDAHVAIGLAVAERLSARRDSWGGIVRYVFQPAEEGLGGALRMIEQGVLDGVDAALGLHIWAVLPTGTVGLAAGPMMAAAAEFSIEILGRGGHAASPHETVDAVLVASQTVVALQSIVARNVRPLDAAVVTVSAVQAGEAFNVIAEQATLKGTARYFDTELGVRIPRRIEELVRGICEAFGAEYRFRYRVISPPTINDPVLAGIVREAAGTVVGTDRLLWGDEVRTMGAEDFGEFLARVPGCFFFVGCADESRGISFPHHNPRFDLSEDALPIAVDVLERAALGYLAGGAGRDG